MANHTPKYVLTGDMLSAAALATSSTEPMLGVKRSRSTDSEDGQRQRPRHESQVFSTTGVSGNASVVNVGRDHITYMNDGLVAETHAVLESIEQRLKVVHDAVQDGKVIGWLSAPDVSQNLIAALRKRQAGTGDWFLHGAPFAEWKENSNIVLCIYGAPGCGKTVLCSTIIEAVKYLCKTRLSGWAYFFFDNRNANEGLQLYENFLRSVLSQLCSRCGGIPEAVTAMYQAHGSGKEQPSIKALEDALRQVIGAFDDVYIMIDSLDESGDRSELLQWIQAMAGWDSARWHLLTTSRSEPDITHQLDWIRNIHIVHLKGMVLDKDISIFLDGRLSLISRWSEPIRALIKTTLVGGADGMFRWVAMHIDSLQTCMNTREVKEKLMALPKDLEETYERILASSARRDDLLQMLHWLAFSARALRLEEIAEVPSVDFDAPDGPRYDPDLKYSHPSIALTVSSGLVTEIDGFVKLAHFSVKEYLISDRIKTGMAAHFAINLHLSHSVIAQTCAAYLLIFNQSYSVELSGGTTNPFPLRLYAAQNLPEHLRLMENHGCPTLQELLLKLFLPTPRYNSALANWVLMHNFDKNGWAEKEVAPPLYYASFLGLRHVVGRLLENGADVDLQGGRHGTALAAAAANDHTEIANLLLERGANADIQEGSYGSAFLLAVERGYFNLAKILLAHGANVNSLGGRYGSALQAAACGGEILMVQLLLEHGADTNIQGGKYTTALRAAAVNGHTEIVAHLLEHGADVDVPGSWDYKDETALQATAANGNTETAKLLLERSANVNIKSRKYGTALQAAASRGHMGIVKALLERGADTKICGKVRGPALQIAASKGHTGIVKVLLEHGVDVNEQERHHGTALQAAAANGHTEAVQFLLERGADANMDEGKYGSALQAATANERTDMVKLLLERRAEANMQEGGYGYALKTAIMNGYTEIFKLLLERRADANIPEGDEYETALQVAASGGRTDIVRILLNRGDEANIQGGDYGSALLAAAYEGHTETAKLLLEGGADINLQTGIRYMKGWWCSEPPVMTALQVAVARGKTETEELLLQYSMPGRD